MWAAKRETHSKFITSEYYTTSNHSLRKCFQATVQIRDSQGNNLASQLIKVGATKPQVHACRISLDFLPCSEIPTIQKCAIVRNLKPSIIRNNLFHSGVWEEREEIYFWLKHAGTLIETACLKYSSWASQNGRSTLAPFSTWIETNKKTVIITVNEISQDSVLGGLVNYTICFGTGIEEADSVCSYLENHRKGLRAQTHQSQLVEYFCNCSDRKIIYWVESVLTSSSIRMSSIS